MNFLLARRNIAICALLCLFTAVGCSPPPGSGTVTPIERYIESGKSRAERNDYDGALLAFEKALSIDMNNATVHYQLALLFDTELNRPEKSLYHFTRVLEINPDYRWSDLIKDRLRDLRMRVSSGSMPMVPCAELEKEIIKLHEDLAQKSEQLQRLASENEKLSRGSQSQAANTRQTTTQSGRQPSRTPTLPRSLSQNPNPRGATTTTQTRRVATQTKPPGGGTQKLDYNPPRQISYTIQKGDTLYSLGRRHGIPHQDILKANPGLVANDIQVGQAIVIPVR